MTTPIKFAARLSHVREVSLVGTAELPYWSDRLRVEGLVPAERAGKAQVLIVAADMSYLGLRFRELSFSILVALPESSPWRTAAYLLHAYNSRWLFALAERTFFSTPYYHGDVRVAATVPASLSVGAPGTLQFRAQMAAVEPAQPRRPVHSADNGWEGPIFLPGKKRLFFASLRGYTDSYPFLSGQDMFQIGTAPKDLVLQELRDSHFTATEWSIRADATHAKSKTYRRSVGNGLAGLVAVAE